MFSQNVTDGKFIHPGLLHSVEDLDRMRTNVTQKNEPWVTAWSEFLKSKWLEESYQASPLEIVGRGVGSTGQNNIQNDCAAAYYNALAWYISGDEKFARKAVEVINAWSYKVRVINGKDAVLCAGIYGYKFTNAAEILRFSYKKWSANDIDQCEKMLLDVFYPVLKDFAPFANGNWDAASVVSMVSIGVFCDNRQIFDRALTYYYAGTGNGSILNYVVNESGQNQESGRDQPHSHLGISFLALAAETAFHQDLNVYGAYNNRLLKAFEYTSKYNLGFDDVPFEPTFDRTGKYNHKVISTKDRRKILTGSEMVFNHYKNRMGVEAPFTEKTALNARPETSSYDMPGTGTLLFALPPFNGRVKAETKIPTMPVQPIAKYINHSICLNWIPVLNATAYSVVRTNKRTGLKTILISDSENPTYTDTEIRTAEMYTYAIKAINKSGESSLSTETNICAGLPANWKNAAIGNVEKTGTTTFNGHIFTLEAAGTDIGGVSDQFQFAYVPLKGNGTITARFVPQVASQFVKTGLMIRESLSTNSKHASLLTMPLAGKDVEVPAWHINLMIRKSTADSTSMAHQSKALVEPFVSWGRFVKPYWLRLSRNGQVITAYISEDGIDWEKSGQVNIALKKNVLIGIALCSRLTKVTTVANFDCMELTGLN
ncbi:MAG: alginate lyase family protein [Paludibacter sp.]|nr:alginate lyase family protein [Paludibacter sp.]